MESTALQFEGVSKVYRSPAGKELVALSSVSFSIPSGRVISVVGRSGSGKSTLLHLAAGIDLPTGGEVQVQGRDLGRLSERQRSLLRRDTVGLVFQFFHLLPHLSVRDNIALPAFIAGKRLEDVEARLGYLLERVGLASRAGESVDRLSGGEMQRVAICRALLSSPPILLADEPTGNLDDDNARTVMRLMLELVRDEGCTLVYVTHSAELASLADETWTIHSGRLET